MTRRTEALTDLHKALTSEIRQHFEELQETGLLSAFAVLRRMKRPDVPTLMACHRLLLAHVREDVSQMGYVNAIWADLPMLVFNAIHGEGYWYDGGRWTPMPSVRALREARSDAQRMAGVS
jgi:hypothetical protein